MFGVGVDAVVMAMVVGVVVGVVMAVAMSLAHQGFAVWLAGAGALPLTERTGLP